MGKKISKKLIIISLLFLLSSVIIHLPSGDQQEVKKTAIAQSFENLDGYKTIKKIRLRENLEEMLKLDDYVYYDFIGEQGKVNLYIGYYYTADKAYASHSPLICYPSQGWKIDTKPKTLSLKSGEHVINYKEVITSHGNAKEIVVYWYQAYLYTNTQIFMNKIDMALNKLKSKKEHHGFVRVSAPFNGSNYEEVKKRVIHFINDFYPKYIQYIDEEKMSDS